MRRKSAFILFVPIVILMIVVDRLSKAWAVDALPLGTQGPDLGLVDLTMVHNFGAAFGMGQGKGLFFAVVAGVILLAIVLWLAIAKEHGRIEVIALGLVAAGAVGNVIDRLTDGYVTDFIEFTFFDFPVFNVADICITVGVVLFIIAITFLAPEESVKEGAPVSKPASKKRGR